MNDLLKQKPIGNISFVELIELRRAERKKVEAIHLAYSEEDREIDDKIRIISDFEKFKRLHNGVMKRLWNATDDLNANLYNSTQAASIRCSAYDLLEKFKNLSSLQEAEDVLVLYKGFRKEAYNETEPEPEPEAEPESEPQIVPGVDSFSGVTDVYDEDIFEIITTTEAPPEEITPMPESVAKEYNDEIDNLLKIESKINLWIFTAFYMEQKRLELVRIPDTRPAGSDRKARVAINKFKEFLSKYNDISEKLLNAVEQLDDFTNTHADDRLQKRANELKAALIWSFNFSQAEAALQKFETFTQQGPKVKYISFFWNR